MALTTQQPHHVFVGYLLYMNGAQNALRGSPYSPKELTGSPCQRLFLSFLWSAPDCLHSSSEASGYFQYCKQYRSSYQILYNALLYPHQMIGQTRSLTIYLLRFLGGSINDFPCYISRSSIRIIIIFRFYIALNTNVSKHFTDIIFLHPFLLLYKGLHIIISFTLFLMYLILS